MTLLCGALHPDHWHQGYELMCTMTIFTPAPLNLLSLDLFLKLLTGEWTMEELFKQHDLLEFSAYLLVVMKPMFLHCAWAPLPTFQGTCEDSHLRDEKGTRYFAIRLPLSTITYGECTLALQELIDTWRDPLGLCRALVQVGKGLCVALERTLTQNTPKLRTIVHIPVTVQFPSFADEAGLIEYVTFRVVAVTYRLGDQISSGHYRTALKTPNGWMAYDDGVIPDRLTSLDHTIQSQVVFVWLTRTMEAAVADDPTSLT